MASVFRRHLLYKSHDLFVDGIVEQHQVMEASYLSRVYALIDVLVDDNHVYVSVVTTFREQVGYLRICTGHRH